MEAHCCWFFVDFERFSCDFSYRHLCIFMFSNSNLRPAFPFTRIQLLNDDDRRLQVKGPRRVCVCGVCVCGGGGGPCVAC